MGLQWLLAVKKETGLLTCVEVALPGHIEKALKHRVDILWIGARTVTNPFSMQEIAAAIRGTDIPVMIKNPVAPDLSTWIGAIERLASAGITKMIAVHRGFHYFQRSRYRNSPLWEIPIELRRQVPGLPVICDPSHICGQKNWIGEVSQTALDLEMDGLMIESHIRPEQALTDATQQITPDELKTLLKHLVIRTPQGDQASDLHLEKLRKQIDSIDTELIETMARRMEIIKEIATHKQKHNLTILQLKRWTDVVYDRLNLGERYGLSREFTHRLMLLLHEEAISIQEDTFRQSQDEGTKGN